MGFTDFVAIAGLIVMLHALIFGSFLSLTRGARRRTQEAVAAVDLNRRLIELSHETTISALNRLHTSLDIHLGLIHELIDYSNLKAFPRLEDELVRVREQNKKSMFELSLLDKEPIRRESAYRALAMSLGDARSLLLMQRAIELRREDGELRRFLVRLEGRLDEGANDH